jgi:hypothetical protein
MIRACAQLVDCTTDLQDTIELITQMKTYRLELLAGDSLRVHMNFLDPLNEERMDLYSPSGVLLKRVETVPFVLGELSWPVSVTGTYFLVLSELDGDDTGAYSLSVEVVNDPSCAQLVDCTTDLQDTIGLITQMKIYRLELLAGDSLRVHMNFLDPLNEERMDLYSPSGELLKSIETVPFVLGELSWPVSVTGTYFLVLSELDGDDTGAYSLSVEVVNDPCLCTTGRLYDGSSGYDRTDYPYEDLSSGVAGGRQSAGSHEFFGSFE